MAHSRPWLQYHDETAKIWAPRYTDMLSAFRDAAQSRSGGIRYLGTLLGWDAIDIASDRLAVEFLSGGVQAGSRVSLLLQNVPSFVIAVVAAWKIGAIPVPSNAAYKAREIANIFSDCKPAYVICHVDQCADVDAALTQVGLGVPVRTVSPRDHASAEWVDRLPAGDEGAHDRALLPILELDAARPPMIEVGPDDIGLLMYTSGTTGRPKGAMISHHSLAFNGQHTADWCGVDASARALCIAPLFHITGFACNICLAIVKRCELLLFYRFEPRLALDIIRAYRPTYAIGAITAYNALASQRGVTHADFASFTQIFSGGAPIAPGLQAALREKTGISIKNCYGMTETTAPTHFTPLGQEAPVDPMSNALSIGVPGFGSDAKVVDEEGRELPPGEIGELLLKGPQIMAGYWNKPEETDACVTDGWMHSGDVAFMDEKGWFFLVDRKKDMICASGFKIWPREVEDALYEHPAVREAAVVGKPDVYRGETVVAYISLHQDADATPKELGEHARARLTGYKCPREIIFLPELPKTVSGKIQRNVLRDTAA